MDEAAWVRLQGDRPWRRVGAVLCLVVGVMFLAGVWWLDDRVAREQPLLFTVYWSLILLLLVWLCVLAFRDVMYTRRALAIWKEGHHEEARECDERVAGQGHGPEPRG
jgi:hypothetical protein